MHTKLTLFIHLISFTICISFVISCEDKFKQNAELTEPDIVINGFISSGDTFRINVSYMKSMWGYKNDSFIYNADVELKLPDNTIQKLRYDSLKYIGHTKTEGFYKLSALVKPQAGIYELIVNLPGKRILVAKDSIPKPVPISFCNFLCDTVKQKYVVQVGFSDPLESTNYYALSINSKNYRQYWIEDENRINGGYYINDNFFWYDVMLSSPNTFIEAPIAGSLNQLVFSDKVLDASKGGTILSANFESLYLKASDSTVFEVRLHSISKAYYNYAISYYKQNQAEKDFYSEPVSVYSNIEGGYGIFAGYSTSEKKIKYVKGKVAIE